MSPAASILVEALAPSFLVLGALLVALPWLDPRDERVRSLMGHPVFSLKNPNRVRALIGSFVNGNPTGFNRADGAGYEFLASSALQIDRFNPHMAARLLGAFESWRTLEPRRQALAKSSLRQLASSQLSTDSYEIVTKTLGAD